MFREIVKNIIFHFNNIFAFESKLHVHVTGLSFVAAKQGKHLVQ